MLSSPPRDISHGAPLAGLTIAQVSSIGAGTWLGAGVGGGTACGDDKPARLRILRVIGWRNDMLDQTRREDQKGWKTPILDFGVTHARVIGVMSVYQLHKCIPIGPLGSLKQLQERLN